MNSVQGLDEICNFYGMHLISDILLQQFQEALSSKARRMFRNAQSQKEVPLGRLEAKFVASEQNRYPIFHKFKSHSAKLNSIFKIFTDIKF